MRRIQTRQQLLARKSRPIEGDRAYTPTELEAQLPEIAGWSQDDGALSRGFAFRDYYETIAFVNALAWVAYAEDHFPELLVQYNRCTVRWSTTELGGVSDNDFICAAKTDAVFGR